MKCLRLTFVARFELGRQAGNTKISSNKTVRRIRVRGGNFKFRALRLDTGNFSWGTEACTRKASFPRFILGSIICIQIFAS